MSLDGITASLALFSTRKVHLLTWWVDKTFCFERLLVEAGTGCTQWSVTMGHQERLGSEVTAPYPSRKQESDASSPF